jgi:hypothetical protein
MCIRSGCDSSDSEHSVADASVSSRKASVGGVLGGSVAKVDVINLSDSDKEKESRVPVSSKKKKKGPNITSAQYDQLVTWLSENRDGKKEWLEQNMVTILQYLLVQVQKEQPIQDANYARTYLSIFKASIKVGFNAVFFEGCPVEMPKGRLRSGNVEDKFDRGATYTSTYNTCVKWLGVHAGARDSRTGSRIRGVMRDSFKNALKSFASSKFAGEGLEQTLDTSFLRDILSPHFWFCLEVNKPEKDIFEVDLITGSFNFQLLNVDEFEELCAHRSALLSMPASMGTVRTKLPTDPNLVLNDYGVLDGDIRALSTFDQNSAGLFTLPSDYYALGARLDDMLSTYAQFVNSKQVRPIIMLHPLWRKYILLPKRANASIEVGELSERILTTTPSLWWRAMTVFSDDGRAVMNLQDAISVNAGLIESLRSNVEVVYSTLVGLLCNSKPSLRSKLSAEMSSKVLSVLVTYPSTSGMSTIWQKDSNGLCGLPGFVPLRPVDVSAAESVSLTDDVEVNVSSRTRLNSGHVNPAPRKRLRAIASVAVLPAVSVSPVDAGVL